MKLKKTQLFGLTDYNIFSFISSYLKLYTTMPIAKLAAFLDMVSRKKKLCGGERA